MGRPTEVIRKEPLLLYLDTSDYSRLADIGHRKEAETLKPIRDFLLEKRRQGSIQIRFSYVHILEILKNTSDDVTLALRKASLIEDLCGQAVFRYPAAVFEAEASHFRSGTLERQIVTSDEGEWYPDVLPDMSGFQDEIAEMLEEALRSHGMPESVVRQYVNHGRVTKRAIRDMSMMLGPLSEQMPMAAGFYQEGAFVDYMKGRRSGEDFAGEFTKGVFSRPTIFINHWFRQSPQALVVFGKLAEQERRLHESMLHSRNLGLDLSKSYPELAKQLGAQLEDEWGEIDFESIGVRELDPAVKTRIFEGVPEPGLEAVSSFFIMMRAYFLDNLRPSKVMRKPRESDPGDLLHLIYMPYTDIFRTDMYMANLIQRSLPPRARVSSELEGLPALIEELEAEKVG
jgi:hypothetical protein